MVTFMQGMRHKASVVLGCVLVALSVSACSDSAQPVLDSGPGVTMNMANSATGLTSAENDREVSGVQGLPDTDVQHTDVGGVRQV